MKFESKDGRFVLTRILSGLIAAKIPARRTRIRGVWLREIDNEMLETMEDVTTALQQAYKKREVHYQLSFHTQR